MPPENKEILIFIGKVEEHMRYNNEIQKDYVFDRKDIYEKIEDLGTRQTQVETKQSFIMKIGSVVLLSIIGFFTRGYWMKH